MRAEECFEIISQTLKARGAEGWEVYIYQAQGLKIELKEGRLDNFQPQRAEGLSLRVLDGQRLGFSFTSQITLDELKNTALKALENARASERDSALDLPHPAPIPKAPESRDKAFEALNLEEKLELAFSAHKMASEQPKIKKIQQVKYQDGLYEINLINSYGISAQGTSSYFSLSCVAVAEKNGVSEMGWDYQASCFFSDISAEKIGKTAAQRAIERLGARQPESAFLPALFRPYITVDFLEILSAAFLGDNVVKGKSRLASFRGKNFFSPTITIIDDGLLPGGLATRAFDDEGQPRQKTPLVVNGTIENFLFDNYWARRAGEASTGNASRGSFKSPPSVAPTNLYLRPGDIDPEEIIKNLAKGIIITEVLGMHTADPISGDFSVGATGLLVENGAIVSPLTGLAIAGNIFDIFKRIEVVCSDLCFYGPVGAPSVLIEGLDISGR
ncbi:TldD/PmbA family protein [Thermosulfuriphilus sp.]